MLLYYYYIFHQAIVVMFIPTKEVPLRCENKCVRSRTQNLHCSGFLFIFLINFPLSLLYPTLLGVILYSHGMFQSLFGTTKFSYFIQGGLYPTLPGVLLYSYGMFQSLFGSTKCSYFRTFEFSCCKIGTVF